MCRKQVFQIAAQHLSLAVIALLIWLVFYPALMSPDGRTQYIQARIGQFDNWHPPLMAIVLSGVMKLGGDVGSLTLLQCLAGLLGLRALILMGGEIFHLSPLSRQWIATSAAALFLLPVTPLAFYLMTFGKDTWLAIILLWGGAYLIWLYLRAEWLKGGEFYFHVAGVATIWAFAYSVRHNALAVLPAVCLCLGLIVRSRRRRFDSIVVAVAILPLCMTAMVTFGLNRIFDVKDAPIASAQKAFDLVTACVIEEESCSSFPYTRSHLESNYKEGYLFGDVWPLLWGDILGKKNIVREGYIKLNADNPEIDQEYRNLLFRRPDLWIKVKALSFAPLLDPRGAPKTWYYSQLEPNDFGLRLNERFAFVRRVMFGVAWRVWHHWLLRWISGVHLAWLVACFAGAFVAFYKLRSGPDSHKFRFGPDSRAVFYVGLMLIPLSYYLSYLVATPSTEFRMMFPATLFAQATLFPFAIRK